MGREFELKYRATAEQLAAIGAAYGPFREITMETTYFDTPDRVFSQRKWTLRQRLENGISVCALKIPGENGSCGEWETECAEISEAVLALCKLGAPEELAALAGNGLTPICSARFIRQAAHIQREDCTVELALDRGFLRGGIRMELMKEVEVELKSGAEEGAVAFANALAEEYRLVPESRSKFKRALALTEMR